MSSTNSAGLAELLELHNTEELRTLCKTLEIGRLGSKKSNFAAVLALLADGAEEAGCRRVLDGVWDGIIIEYLRSLGKNLMKCKDDIRGAALQHWKRNTAAVIGARAAGSQGLAAPVFMKGSVWRRTNATSDTDVQVRRFLRRLEATEGDLKTLEKGVRARPDFEMVTKFLAQIHVVRDLEEDFRGELLNMLQDLLGERDVMLESAKRAAAEANEARARARDIEKHDVSRSFFVGLADVMHQQRILESIRIQVEITQRERDIEALHDKIARMIRAHVLQEGELRLRIEELETDLADTSETLRLRSECLADTERRLLERDEELAALRADFDAFRVGAEALVAGSLARSSQAEADALQASEFAKRERSRAKKLEGELEDALRKVAEANQQRECAEMEAADREALEVRADEALRLALQLEEEEKALAAEELAKASAEKGKGKSKGKGKGPGKGKSGKGGKASPAGKKGGKSSPTAGKKDGKASPKSPAKKSGKKSPAGAKKAKKR
ncbi:Hypothetical Protein FCC1311_003412 [Hondaea fermentalgiana]|uniref:Uncharacterized protein n=1 Tax=Hondaea fermentalgiana TaxID=2315210 RepID=A0A2R5G6Q3_9STRA|nr:Hypothetical Protein FCC1311_003412 [Hondaea fermentalgiana]|eukprot:GBG24123.1 Hypothetical Protein FCC1311_003412 [Hondaea fermentalgiana]